MPKVTKTLKNRGRQIDRAVNQATKPKPKKKPAAKKNPYPKGSYRAKAWARREADKKKK